MTDAEARLLAGADEGLFQAIADALPQIVWTCRSDGRAESFNRRWYQYTGLTPAESLGNEWLRVLHPEDRTRSRAAWEAAWRSGSAYEVEYRLRCPDGRHRWFLARALPIRDEQGRVVKWFGTSTDIDEFKRNELRLEFLGQVSDLLASTLDYEQTLATLVDLIVPRLADGCAVDLLDEDGRLQRLRYVHADPKQAELGLELWRRLPPDPGHPDGAHALMNRGKAQLISEVSDPVLEERLKDPATADAPRAPGHHAAMAVPLVARGRPLGLLSFVASDPGRRFDEQDLAFAEDLAQRAAAAVDNAQLYREAQSEIQSRLLSEQRLKAESSRVEGLNRVGQVLAAELDLERLVQRLTDEATTISGAAFGAFFYNVQNERGESYTLYTISGVDRSHFEKFPMPRNTKIFAPTFKGEGVVRLHDVTRDPRFGQNPPYRGMPEGHLPVRSYLAAPVVTRGGEVLGGLFFGHPEPGRFDEQVERSLLAICSQAAIAIENARLYQRAQDAVRLRDEFLSLASHELRTPVTTLKLVAHGLRQAAKKGDPAEVEERSRRMDKQVDRMVRLVNALLDVSRLSSGRLTLDPEECGLREVTREVISRVAEELQRTGSTIELIAPDEVTGTWDRLRLEQVISNLLTNAAKYGEGRPIHVRIATETRRAVLVVRDEGIGIAPEDHARIFDRFERAQGAKPFAGFGLGLWIVRSFVRAMGGTVSVESEPGKGATFRVELPLHPDVPS